MNAVCLVGRIGNDPEMKYTPNGTAVCHFRLGVSRDRKSEDGERESDWFDVTAFGQQAEFVSQYLDKGAQVGVTGRLESRTWEQDGAKRYAVGVVAQNVTALETKAEAERRRERA